MNCVLLINNARVLCRTIMNTALARNHREARKWLFDPTGNTTLLLQGYVAFVPSGTWIQ